MIDRPTEDSEEEYPHVRNMRLKRKNAEQYSDYDESGDED